jgi:hypothetical protein
MTRHGGAHQVTRAEYAAFVRETGYPAGDRCGVDSFKREKRPELTWQHPGFEQTGRDQVCFTWQDARAYVAWLNRKARHGAAPGDGLTGCPAKPNGSTGLAREATRHSGGAIAMVKRPRMRDPFKRRARKRQPWQMPSRGPR